MGNHIMFYKCLTYMSCSKNTSQGFSCSRSDGGDRYKAALVLSYHIVIGLYSFSYLQDTWQALQPELFFRFRDFPPKQPKPPLHAEFLLLFFFLCLSCKDTLLLEIQQFIPPRPLLSPQVCFLRILLHLFLPLLLSRVSLLFLPAYQ